MVNMPEEYGPRKPGPHLLESFRRPYLPIQACWRWADAWQYIRRSFKKRGNTALPAERRSVFPFPATADSVRENMIDLQHGW